MHLGGAIHRRATGAEIRVAADEDHPVFFGDRFRRHPLLGEHRKSDRINADAAQGSGVVGGAARVTVLFGNEFLDGMLTIANDMRRVTAGDGNEFAPNDQHPVVFPFGKLLHDDRAAFLTGGSIGGDDLLTGVQVQSDAASLVPVQRFHDDWQADFVGGSPGIFSVLHRAALRHRQANFIEQAQSEVFVLDDVLRNRAGLTGGGGQDFPLFGTPAELHQTTFSEAVYRDAPQTCCIDHGTSAGSEADLLSELAQSSDGRVHIQGLSKQCGVNQTPGEFKGRAGNGFFIKLGDDAIRQGLRCRHQLAKAHLKIRAALQMQRDGLQQGRQSFRLGCGADFTDLRRQGRQPGEQPGTPVGAVVGQFRKLHLAFQDRLTRPKIRAAQRKDFANNGGAEFAGWSRMWQATKRECAELSPDLRQVKGNLGAN